VVLLLNVVVYVEHVGQLVTFEVQADAMNWQNFSIPSDILFHSLSGFLLVGVLVCRLGDSESFSVFSLIRKSLLLLVHYLAIGLKKVFHPGDMRMILLIVFHEVQNLFHLAELDVRLILGQQFKQKPVNLCLDCVLSDLRLHHNKDLIHVNLKLVHERQVFLDLVGCCLVKIY
jgi:hypothetical protein